MEKILAKKLSLMEAKDLLGTEQVFLTGEDLFAVYDSGKYKSGLVFELPKAFRVNRKAEPVSPLRYISCREITEGLNIDFDADSVGVMFGNFRGEEHLIHYRDQVFRVTRPTQASHLLLRADWGEKTHGRFASDVDALYQGVTWFKRSASNGGAIGYDYYVVPINYVANRADIDRSEILKGIEERRDAADEEASKEAQSRLAELAESRANREQILHEIRPIIAQLHALNEHYALEEGIEEATLFGEKHLYKEELVAYAEKVLQQEISRKVAYDKYVPLFREAVQACPVRVKSSFDSTFLEVQKADEKYPNPNPRMGFGYDEDGYAELVKFLADLQRVPADTLVDACKKADAIKAAAQK